MKKSLRRSAVLVAPCMMVSCALVGLIGCVQDPAPFDPQAAQSWQLRKDTEVKSQPLYPLPTTAASYYGNDDAGSAAAQPPLRRNLLEGPPVRMSLQEVIHRTVANNLEIRVASYDTAIDQTRVLEAQANFDPSFFADINFQRVDKMTPGTEASTVSKTANIHSTSASTAFPSDIIVTYDNEALWTSDVGIRQNLAAGGKIEIKQEVSNSWFSPQRALLNTYYENDLVLTLTQPLLQNFGVAVNQARITIAQNSQRVSLLDFRKTVEDTVLKVEQTYWQQVQAERDVESVKKLIQESERLGTVLEHRIGNDVTSAQIQQVHAQTFDRQTTLVELQSHVEDLSDQLKQLMNDPSFPVSGWVIITPSEDGTELPLNFNLDDQIETAMQNRYELGQQQVRIDSAEIAVDVARNNRLPSLTAQLEGTVDGLEKDLGAAFNKEGDFNHLGYQFGLQFQMPIGNRAAAAIWQRSLMQRMQAIASYAGLVNTVSLEVKTAARQVSTSWQRLETARKSRLAYEKLLAAVKEQDDQGDQTYTFDSVFVRLQNQQFLAAAEQTEHLAENDYNYAIANLEKSKGTILRYNNVLMEQEQLPFDMAVKGTDVPSQMLIGNPQ